MHIDNEGRPDSPEDQRLVLELVSRLLKGANPSMGSLEVKEDTLGFYGLYTGKVARFPRVTVSAFRSGPGVVRAPDSWFGLNKKMIWEVQTKYFELVVTLVFEAMGA